MADVEAGKLPPELESAFSRCSTAIARGRSAPAIRALSKALRAYQAQGGQLDSARLLANVSALVAGLEQKLSQPASRWLSDLLPATEQAPLGLTCSFCGKHEKEVAKLIAGPAVFICDSCVGLCNDILGNPGGSGATS